MVALRIEKEDDQAFADPDSRESQACTAVNS